MNYHNLTVSTTEELQERKWYLENRLAGVFGPNSKFDTASEKRVAQWQLDCVKRELAKKYRRG